MRCFELHRDTDETGVSGTGIVADGVAFADDVVMLRWRGPWPTSVCWYDRGVEAVEHVHGHNGSTRIVWSDDLPIKAVRERVSQYVPCICGPEYTERGLEDPACRHHDAMDALDSLAEDG
jgi:hypothetical protein